MTLVGNELKDKHQQISKKWFNASCDLHCQLFCMLFLPSAVFFHNKLFSIQSDKQTKIEC